MAYDRPCILARGTDEVLLGGKRGFDGVNGPRADAADLVEVLNRLQTGREMRKKVSVDPFSDLKACVFPLAMARGVQTLEDAPGRVRSVIDGRDQDPALRRPWTCTRGVDSFVNELSIVVILVVGVQVVAELGECKVLARVDFEVKLVVRGAWFNQEEESVCVKVGADPAFIRAEVFDITDVEYKDSEAFLVVQPNLGDHSSEVGRA